MSLGIETYASKNVFDSMKLGILANRRNLIEYKAIFQVGNFKIMAFDLKHDVPTLGFLINHPKTGNILFATDTYDIPYNFPDLNHIIIEANYDNKILSNNVDSGKLNDFIKRRVQQSHMSLSNTIKILKRWDLSKVQNIVLIHLSDGNADPKEFKRKVEATTAKRVYIASPGLKISINTKIF